LFFEQLFDSRNKKQFTNPPDDTARLEFSKNKCISFSKLAEYVTLLENGYQMNTGFI
jgi:hypothetical protein